MMKIIKNTNKFCFEMMALTGFLTIQGLVALNSSATIPNGGVSGWNDHGDNTNRYHRNLIFPIILGECRGSCGNIHTCNSGLSCARDNQATLTAAGLDPQFAYCPAPFFRAGRYFCYDPKKLPTKKVTCSPSFGYDGVDLRNAVKDYASGDPTKIANLTSIYGNISDWCTSAVSDWSNMFSYDSFNEDISKWDTSNATTMSDTFLSAYSFNQDISKWNTSKVTTMYDMFNDAYTFNQDISKWDTSNVEDMSHMFFGAYNFNQDISKWNTSKVTTMDSMFEQAYTFNHDISKWNTSKVTTMSYMFDEAYTFNQDISKWDTSNVESMSSMFLAAYSFNKDISRWNTSKVNDMSYMFNDAYSFNQNISLWDTSQVTYIPNMFYNAYSFNQDVSNWDISKVTFMNGMFANAKKFKQNLCSWNNKCSGSLVPPSNVFKNTACPDQTNPICGTGSFCYSC